MEPRIAWGVFEGTQIEVATPLLLGESAANGNGDVRIGLLRKLWDDRAGAWWPGNQVVVIDAATYQVRGRVPVGKEPAHVVLTLVIDVAKRKVVATVPVGRGPNGISVSPGTRAS